MEEYTIPTKNPGEKIDDKKGEKAPYLYKIIICLLECFVLKYSKGEFTIWNIGQPILSSLWQMRKH